MALSGGAWGPGRSVEVESISNQRLISGVSPEDPLAVVRVSDEGQPFASSTEDEELLAEDLCIPGITPHP